MQHTFFLITKKNKFASAARFLSSLPLFCTTTRLFCRTKTSNFQVTHYFYGGIVVCAYPIFCLLCTCLLFNSFHCRLFSPCRPLVFLIVSQPLWIFMFSFLQNSSLLFSITRSSSFSVIHVSVNIKNNVEKTLLCCCFFLSKSPGGHAIFFQIKPMSCIWVAIPVDWIILHWYTCGADGRSGGRSVGRSVGVRYVITKFSRMGSLLHFFTLGAPLRALRARELRYEKVGISPVKVYERVGKCKNLLKNQKGPTGAFCCWQRDNKSSWFSDHSN